jgi:hypothetical protein
MAMPDPGKGHRSALKTISFHRPQTEQNVKLISHRPGVSRNAAYKHAGHSFSLTNETGTKPTT